MEIFLIITYALSAVFCLIMIIQDGFKRYYLGLNITRSDITLSVIVIFCPIFNTWAVLSQLYDWSKELFNDKVVIKGRRE